MTILSDIRPTARPIAPLTPAAPRTAAQRAFFDAALGRAAGVEGPAQAPQVQTSQIQTPLARPESQPAIRTASLQTALRNLAAFAPAPAPDSPAEAPRRILRPGSLVDIKV